MAQIVGGRGREICSAADSDGAGGSLDSNNRVKAIANNTPECGRDKEVIQEVCIIEWRKPTRMINWDPVALIEHYGHT